MGYVSLFQPFSWRTSRWSPFAIPVVNFGWQASWQS